MTPTMWAYTLSKYQYQYGTFLLISMQQDNLLTYISVWFSLFVPSLTSQTQAGLKGVWLKVPIFR